MGSREKGLEGPSALVIVTGRGREEVLELSFLILETPVGGRGRELELVLGSLSAFVRLMIFLSFLFLGELEGVGARVLSSLVRVTTVLSTIGRS